MHEDTLEQLQHSHDFTVNRDRAEKNTTTVMWLTVVTMVLEIVAGSFLGSMALLADGWHMATHVAAFGIAVFAYRYARRHAHNPKYTFGTGKVTILGGYTSAVVLGATALTIAIESITRFVQPVTIQFNQAIVIAVLGLLVNLASAWLLQDHHEHHHETFISKYVFSMDHKMIAKQFGITSTQVNRIKNGTNWKQVNLK